MNRFRGGSTINASAPEKARRPARSRSLVTNTNSRSFGKFNRKPPPHCAPNRNRLHPRPSNSSWKDFPTHKKTNTTSAFHMMDKKGHPHPPRHVVRLELHAQQLKNVAGFRGISGASSLEVIPCLYSPAVATAAVLFSIPCLSPDSPVP
jgi:hypothetical protein